MSSVINRYGFWIAVVAVVSLTAADLHAQGGRRRRGQRTMRQPAPPPEPQKKEEEDTRPKTYLAIKNADVYVGTGQRIRNCDILIANDKIEKVGPGIEIPEKAKVIDAKDKVVSPGFVAVKASGIGISRYGRVDKDSSIKDSINPFDPTIKMGLAAGMTSYCWLSGRGTGKPGGTSAVIKLAYGDLEGMVLEEGSVMSMSVPLTMAEMKSFRDLVKKAKEHKKALAKHLAEESKAPATAPTPKPTGTPPAGRGRTARSASASKKAPKPPQGTEEILKVMDGEVKLWITAPQSRQGPDWNNNSIRQAMEIAELLGVGVVLDGPTTAWSIPDVVAARGSMAIVNPRENRPPDPAAKDTTGSNIRMCAILADAGVPVAVTPPPGGYGGGASLGTGGILGHDLHTMHIDAAYAVRGGLDNAKALRTITLDAAKIVGADARIGSIEAGKDADILILDGDPLHYRTFVQTAIVNGKVVYEKDKEPFYRHIKR